MNHPVNKKSIIIISLIYTVVSIFISVLFTSIALRFIENKFVKIYINLALCFFITLALIEGLYKFITGKPFCGLIYLFGWVRKADGIKNGFEKSEMVVDTFKNSRRNNIVFKYLKKNWKNILLVVSNICTVVVWVISQFTSVGWEIMVGGFDILPICSVVCFAVINIIAVIVDPFRTVSVKEAITASISNIKAEIQKQKADKVEADKVERAKLLAEQEQAAKIEKAKALLARKKAEAEAVARQKAEEAELLDLARKLEIAENAAKAQEANKV